MEVQDQKATCHIRIAAGDRVAQRAPFFLLAVLTGSPCRGPEAELCVNNLWLYLFAASVENSICCSNPIQYITIQFSNVADLPSC